MPSLYAHALTVRLRRAHPRAQPPAHLVCIHRFHVVHSPTQRAVVCHPNAYPLPHIRTRTSRTPASTCPGPEHPFTLESRRRRPSAGTQYLMFNTHPLRARKLHPEFYPTHPARPHLPRSYNNRHDDHFTRVRSPASSRRTPAHEDYQGDHDAWWQ